MTDKECTKVLILMSTAYPNAYKDFDETKTKNAVYLWQKKFENDLYDDVKEAVYKLIDECNFPPSIAEIKKQLKLDIEARENAKKWEELYDN